MNSPAGRDRQGRWRAGPWDIASRAHILLRSSEFGLSGFMRRLLTGYAIRYNHRHRLWGHLFQNRYKSIVCDEREKVVSFLNSV